MLGGQHTDRMQIAFKFSIFFGAFSIPLSLVVGFVFVWGAVLLGMGVTLWTFASGFILTLGVCALVITHALISALSDASWMLVEQVADYFDTTETNRKVLEQAQAAQFNINSGGGQMKVTNKPITYRVNGQIVTNHLTQINHHESRKIEIPAADVRWFCEQLPVYGHSQSKWVTSKIELPYSRLDVDRNIYKALIAPLADGGAIVGRGARASGKLIETDPSKLVKVIEQAHPGAASKGITLELPSQTSQTERSD